MICLELLSESTLDKVFSYATIDRFIGDSSQV